MTIKASAYLLAASLLPFHAMADGISGNDIYSACNSGDGGAQEGFCLGYLIGTVEGMKWGSAFTIARLTEKAVETDDLNAFSNVVLGFCLPSDAPNGQLLDVFVKYLQDNPAIRHQSARTLVQSAFTESFPCGQ